ncbi:hypothetical protein [Rhizobium nepotum]|uniref:hypothetical protein n=1 Tax=Rhizobium nepotum TaxID=1035271 RepID=UPI003CF31C95
MNLKAKVPLESQAYYVWCGAKSGREFARCEDPHAHHLAVRRMVALSGVVNEKFPSLTRVAQDAATDISFLLFGHARVSG